MLYVVLVVNKLKYFLVTQLSLSVFTYANTCDESIHQTQINGHLVLETEAETEYYFIYLLNCTSFGIDS